MSLVPSFNEDLFADAVIKDPWPVYARMRELGPVVYVTTLGNYALPRHREVQQALRDHATFISASGVAADQFGCDFLQGNTVASDGDRHSILRSAMAPPILPGALVEVADKVQAAADGLVDQLVAQEEFDAVVDLARFLPFNIVRDLVGLPEFGQDKMLEWAAAAFDVLGVQNQRGKDALPVIKEMREFIERDATRENLKEGSWTHRIHELVDAGKMPADCAAFAIRDYINPSLDTTISATAELIRQLADNPDQWERLKQQPELIGNAVNEAVRLATPIRTFSRHTSRDIELSGMPIPAGSRVMMLFASANRDERKFPQPDSFDVTRNGREHVGFGSGVHMCVGMHLAQLEMQALLKAMIPRVAEIRIGTPAIKMNNTICAYENLPCRFSTETRSFQVVNSRKQRDEPARLSMNIATRRNIAENIVCLDLVSNNGTALPEATAGSHIDLYLKPGLTRQYSLTDKPDKGVYRIAVQKEADSRGGSQWVHEHLVAGSSVDISEPRNHFPLQSSDEPVLLISGGIGITPLLAMAWSLHHRNQDFSFHICARTKARIPFANELDTWPFRHKLHFHVDDQSLPGPALDVVSLVKEQQRARLYVCGPAGFMDFVVKEAIAGGIDNTKIHLEHFGNEVNTDGDSFTLIASKSGKTLFVPEDKTALQVLTAAGIAVETSCEQGVCGSCLTRVLQGIPDHRDSVQTDKEKSGNNFVTVCCSRSQSKTLVLDI